MSGPRRKHYQTNAHGNPTSTFERRVAEAASTTWQTIGDDILTEMERQGKNPLLSREHVIELVLDADNLLSHGRLDHRDRVAYKALNHKVRLEMVSVAFKGCEYYGW